MQQIQLIHPEGKKAVSMDKGKYNVLKKPLLDLLKTKGESTHKELFHAIIDDFDKNNTTFEGSVEWVKLDLEARKEIKRIGDRSPIKFALA